MRCHHKTVPEGLRSQRNDVVHGAWLRGPLGRECRSGRADARPCARGECDTRLALRVAVMEWDSTYCRQAGPPFAVKCARVLKTPNNSTSRYRSRRRDPSYHFLTV